MDSAFLYRYSTVKSCKFTLSRLRFLYFARVLTTHFKLIEILHFDRNHQPGDILTGRFHSGRVIGINFIT